MYRLPRGLAVLDLIQWLSVNISAYLSVVASNISPCIISFSFIFLFAEKGGKLYCWGVAYCTGLGRVKNSVYSPEIVDTFPVDFDSIPDEFRREEQQAEDDDGLSSEDQVQFSCRFGLK